MLGFVKIGCGDVLCLVRVALPYQSPLVNTRSGVLEEVVQQDLYNVRNLQYSTGRDLHR